MSNVGRLDEILTTLRAQLDRGGLTYQRAVDLDYLISTFERIQALRIAKDHETGRSDTRALSRPTFYAIRRGKST